MKNFLWRHLPSILLGFLALVITAIPIFGWGAVCVLRAIADLTVLAIAHDPDLPRAMARRALA